MNSHSRALLVGCGALFSGGALAAPFAVTLSPHDAALRCHARATPALTLTAPPAGTRSLALVFWDQRPGKLSGRWVAYDVPVTALNWKSGAASTFRPGGGKVGVNDAGKPGYTAPCGLGRHDVYVDAYALNVASLGFPAGAPLRRVHAAIHRHQLLEARAHVVAQGQ